MLRTPSAIEGEGGAISEDQARERGRMVQVRDQMAQLAFENGLKVPNSIADSLLPTPNTMEHREVKSPEQIAELKRRSPDGYRNLREEVINELFPTPAARDYKDGSTDHERDGVVQTDTVARAIFSSGEIVIPNTEPEIDGGGIPSHANSLRLEGSEQKRIGKHLSKRNQHRG